MISTLSNTSRIAARNHERNRCAASGQAAGTSAPERKRPRVSGSYSASTGAQALKMKRGGFGRGDEIGGRAGLGRARDGDGARDAQRRGDLVHRGERFGHAALAEISIGDGDAERSPTPLPISPAVFEWRAVDQRRIVRVGALKRVEDEGEIRGRSARWARGDRGWCRRERCRRGKAGRRSASGRRGRRTMTAREWSRWCPTRG